MGIVDIAWLAGILEGEGSFYTYTKNKITSYPELSVQSVDYDVIAKIALMLRSKISNVKIYSIHTKQESYKVRACSTKAIEWMMTIYPFMSNRRKEKIREVINNWKSTVDGRSLRRGPKYRYYLNSLSRQARVKRVFNARYGIEDV